MATPWVVMCASGRAGVRVKVSSVALLIFMICLCAPEFDSGATPELWRVVHAALEHGSKPPISTRP